MLIDSHLYEAEQGRDSLDFIDHHGFRVSDKKFVGIFLCKLARLQVFQVGIGKTGEHAERQGGFAALPGPEQRDGGILFHQASYQWFDFSRDHGETVI